MVLERGYNVSLSCRMLAGFGMPDDDDLPSTFSVEYVRAWKQGHGLH